MAGQFKRYGKEIRDDFVYIFVEAMRTIRRRWLISLGYLILLGCVALAVHRWDHPLYHRMDAHKESHDRVALLAKRWRDWGAFYDTLAISALVWTFGVACRKRRWRVAAMACFLSASLSGLGVNAIRWSTGRARPYSDYPDKFYGPSFNDKKQSFPSGHSGTSSGGAIGLAVTMPVLGVPAIVSAGGVMWASMYKGRHYLSDCLAGLMLGLYFGVLVGVIARRRMREEDPPPEGG